MDLSSFLLAVGALAGVLGLAVLGVAGLVLAVADLTGRDPADLGPRRLR